MGTPKKYLTGLINKAKKDDPRRDEEKAVEREAKEPPVAAVLRGLVAHVTDRIDTFTSTTVYEAKGGSRLARIGAAAGHNFEEAVSKLLFAKKSISDMKLAYKNTGKQHSPAEFPDNLPNGKKIETAKSKSWAC